MKSVILEIKETKAVVLTQQGDFKEVKMNKGANYHCGDYLELFWLNRLVEWVSLLKQVKSRKLAIIFTLVAVLVLLPVFGNYQMGKVAGYVNIDINPSVQLTYDMKMHIVEAISLNEDGKLLLDKYNIRSMPVNDAIKTVVGGAITEDYISGNKDNGIIITSTTLRKSIDLIEIEAMVNSLLSNIPYKKVKYLSGDSDNFNLAQSKKMSPGVLLIDAIIDRTLGRTESHDELGTYELIELYEEAEEAEEAEERDDDGNSEDGESDDEATEEFLENRDETVGEDLDATEETDKNTTEAIEKADSEDEEHVDSEDEDGVDSEDEDSGDSENEDGVDSENEDGVDSEDEEDEEHGE